MLLGRASGGAVYSELGVVNGPDEEEEVRVRGRSSEMREFLTLREKVLFTEGNSDPRKEYRIEEGFLALGDGFDPRKGS